MHDAHHTQQKRHNPVVLGAYEPCSTLYPDWMDSGLRQCLVIADS